MIQLICLQMIREEAKRQAEQVTVERMDHRIGRTRTKESNPWVSWCE